MCIDCVGISNIERGRGGNFQDNTSKVVGNYFDKNRRGSIDCSAVVYFPLIKMEVENLSNKDRKKIRLLFSLQVESPIICPLLQKLDENGLFPEENL